MVSNIEKNNNKLSVIYEEEIDEDLGYRINTSEENIQLRYYISDNEIIEVIECNGCYYRMTESCDAIIRYPIELESDSLVDYSKLSSKDVYNLTVYNFVNNWWGLDEFDLEDFTFYFCE